MVRMLRKIKSWNLQRQSATTIEELFTRYNPILRGWWNYYGSFYRSAMDRVFLQVDRKVAYWGRRKYRCLAGQLRGSVAWLGRIARRNPQLFIHWLVRAQPGASIMGAV